MNFYFPLRLGIERQRAAARREEQDGHPKPQAYEAWREGTERRLTEYEELPEAQVLKAICHSAPAQRLTFILGEPGAGKTTLFVDWFLRLAREVATEVRLGARLPVLIRMRSVPAHIWNTNEEGELADALWEHACTERTIFEPEDGPDRSPESLYTLDAPQARVFSLIWLFDGLDEVAPSLSGDEHFYQKLACLPGQKAVSARIAVYQSLREVAKIYKWKEYEILGLSAKEQARFLAQALRLIGTLDAEGRSKSLVAEIRRNTAVHMLAGNPMMLGLLAEFAAGDEEALVLPLSRSKFYEQSVNRLWHTKLRVDRDALRMREERDRFLTAQAAAMELGTLRAPMPHLAEDLERGLRKSGLIRVHEEDGSFEFLHLTFQEYYLAQHLRTVGLRAALEQHWVDARYEETLGLLVSLLFEEKRYQEIQDGIQWLVKWGADTHRKNPSTLWKIGRSPMRTALHILGRAGVSLEVGELEGLLESLLRIPTGARRGRRREVMKLALAMDCRMPPEVLGHLAADENRFVRGLVAKNASTKAELLGRLAAEDEVHLVRKLAAENVNAPLEVLGRLATGRNRDLRMSVAANEMASAEFLDRLAADLDSAVRWGVAVNAVTPPELLGRLAGDEDSEVRLGIAENPGTPAELLDRLAGDKDSHVRSNVAGNPGTSAELLDRLAADLDSAVRLGVAANEVTPAGLLGRLARDEDSNVRWGVAGNAATPAELLNRLAGDKDSDVRLGVAGNAGTPAELLDRLAGDKHSDVRWGVAGNAGTPVELLGRLAGDEDSDVRRNVAGNAGTPAEFLDRLAGEKKSDVRWGVARNASPPSEFLGRLAADEDTRVRWCVAENACLLLEDLL
jgi:ABC-type cobalamin/Fe3+-siderophores transport system ATPase subunit/ethanolamine utilization microcompartment shell protein EutL